MKAIFQFKVSVLLSLTSLLMLWSPIAAQVTFGSLGDGLLPYGDVLGLTYDTTNQRLFAAGDFRYLEDSTETNGLAYYDGTSWNTIPGFGESCTLNCNTVGRPFWVDDTLYVTRFWWNNGADYGYTTVVPLPWGWAVRDHHFVTDGPIRGFGSYQNHLVMYGEFGAVDQQPAQRFAWRENGNWKGASNTNFQPGEGIRSAQVFNGKLFMGGTLHSTPYNGLLQWDGNSLTTLRFDDFYSGSVEDLLVYKNELYLNVFRSSNQSNPLRKYSNGQFSDQGLMLGADSANLNFSTIYSMYPLGDRLYVTGQFDRSLGGRIPYLLYFDGSKWCSPTATRLPVFVSQLAAYNGDLVLNMRGRLIYSGDTINVMGRLPVGPPHQCGPPVSVHQPTPTPKIRVFPNPATEFMYLENVPIETTILLLDLSGRAVRQWRANPDNSYHLEGLASGMYHLLLPEYSRSKPLVIHKN